MPTLGCIVSMYRTKPNNTFGSVSSLVHPNLEFSLNAIRTMYHNFITHNNPKESPHFVSVRRSNISRGGELIQKGGLDPLCRSEVHIQAEKVI